MSKLKVFFLSALIGFFVTSCSPVSTHPPDDLVGTVTGTVTYFEKIKIPENSVLNLKLIDIGYSTEEKPMWLVEENITPLKQIPIPFKLRYKKSDVQPNRAYAIQARILVDGKILFKNTTTYKVITQGNPVNDVKIVVKIVSTPPPPPNWNSLKGIVVYQRKIDFLSNTIVDIKLVDLSEDDSSKAILGEETIANPTEWPISFALKYNANAIDRDHRYVIEASVTVGNTIHFLNQAAYPVLTQGGPSNNLEITIEPISFPTKTASVTGSVTFYQEIGLPSDAVAIIELIDATSKNPASRTIGKQSLAFPGYVPFAFEVKYDPLVIHPGHTYAIQARIMTGGQLHFKNMTPYEVITRGHPSTLDVIVDLFR
jgi:putative lipoprotein